MRFNTSAAFSIFAGALAAAGVPASAQAMGGAAQAQQSMVARQPAAIDQAIDRWEALSGRGNYSFAQYADFLLTYPNFPLSEQIRIKAENRLDEEAPERSALVRYFDRFPPLTNSARARYALALAGDRNERAFEIARAAWRGGEMSGPTEAYLAGLYGARFTRDDHKARMDALLWQGRADDAARHMIMLDPADRDLAMARLALVRGALPESAGIATPPGASRDAGYVFNLINHYRATRQIEAAIDLLSTRQPFAAPAFAPEEMIGDMLAVAQSAGATSAVRIAARTDDLFAPDTDVSQGSFRLRDRYTDLMWLGGTKALWELRDGAAAAPLFERYGMGAQSPLTKAKGFYWAGRAARQAGMEEDARALFEKAAKWPDYYYGQLALQALGRPMPAFAPLPTASVDAATRAAYEARPLSQAILAMAGDRRDWRTERRFFQAVAANAANERELILAHDLAMRAGLPEMAVVLGMEAAERFSGLERIGFPTLPTPTVNDWTMVHAISRQESEFDRTRVSHAGARGIMQLMPGTAREQAGKLGVQYMSANLIESPSYNINLGDAYFARMMSYYGGAYPLAVGAYNAGPGRVNQWLRLNGDPRTGEIDWVTWIERIPANFETRYYIMRVLGNAVTYSHMYPSQAGLPRPISAFLR
ncbi:MAG: lytic transglycosylase domain-containing protein [Erythrobacter sp.]|jgi:soluble lytic murein transglycosylase|nr:lytic transglycosylase domain-containing protein [Erythrobacter sp.]